MLDKPLFQSYYTNSGSIVNTMIQALDVDSHHSVLEPSAGEGVFIDALIRHEPAIREIHAYELNPQAFDKLTVKYSNHSNIRLHHANTLFDSELDTYIQNGGRFDRIIANPPYGAWLDYEQRKYLKGRYPDLYVKETYALFLYRCIQLLVDGGRLVFIIPDTFLNLHLHTHLRKMILETCCVISLSLFPSSFFPEVNFGYANLCIITLQKSKHTTDNTFRVYTGFSRVGDLESPDNAKTVYMLKQSDMHRAMNHALFISDDRAVMQSINHAPLRVGDVADCVTGFYSGNDKANLKTTLDRKNYDKVDLTTVYSETPSPELRQGIPDETEFVPIVKGGAVTYVKPDEWFMRWTGDAVARYKSDKKARFQNVQYYFRDGIGIPMVSSSRISASLLEGRLFDQSIVGVFPHDDAHKWYLLAFFNSLTCNKLIRTINPSANNSARYIRKIPLILPDEDTLTVISALVMDIIHRKKTGLDSDSQQTQVEGMIQKIYGF